MSSSGFLAPPDPNNPNQAKDKMWKETWKKIDEFLPDLKKDIGIDEVARPVQKISETTAASKDEVQKEKASDA